VNATIPVTSHMLVQVLVQIHSFPATYALELVLGTRPVHFNGVAVDSGHRVNEMIRVKIILTLLSS